MLTPKQILQEYWGFNSFREPQEQIIQSVLEGKHVVALLPTGGGKSVCYQIPALAKKGIAIVVSPLVALMKEQVQQLKNKGIKAVALTGGLSASEVDAILDNCIYGNYKFLYLSPERLQQDIVQYRIRQMNVNVIAIDEAHCVSQWGHDFRPAYLQCNLLLEWFPETPVIAVTATATKTVLNDITHQLKLRNPVVYKKSFARPNISFNVYYEEDKHYKLLSLLEENKGSAIIYVRNRKATVDIANYLNNHNCKATFYHGGLTSQKKQEHLNFWLNNKANVMVATNAFGMGIDKSNVYTVVHLHLPDSIESYYQEAGRAGRDGNPSQAAIITSSADVSKLQSQFLGVLPDVSFVKTVYKKLNSYLQIPYGEGFLDTYQLRFNSFCQAYGFSPTKTYNTLKILDKHAVISLSEEFNRKATIHFIVSNNQVFYYLEQHKSSAHVLQTILRTYGGVFDVPTKINTSLIAKKSNTPEDQVFKILEQAAKDNIINYKAQHTDLEITFLVAREDDKTINVIAKHIKQQNQLKTKQVNAVIEYIKDTKTCKSVFLLNYFGENVTTPCKQCSVCKKQASTPSANLPALKTTVVNLLKKQPYSSREIVKKLDCKEEDILKVLRSLLEENKIIINHKNQYSLPE